MLSLLFIYIILRCFNNKNIFEQIQKLFRRVSVWDLRVALWNTDEALTVENSGFLNKMSSSKTTPVWYDAIIEHLTIFSISSF